MTTRITYDRFFSCLIIEQASAERDRILEHYNILLDNPVTILHQEQAKVFFSQKDAEKNLWEFVMASTQMKAIHDEYRDSKYVFVSHQ